VALWKTLGLGQGGRPLANRGAEVGKAMPLMVVNSD